MPTEAQIEGACAASNAAHAPSLLAGESLVR